MADCRYIKTSNEVKDYAIDWAEETTDVSQTLSTSTFTVPAGITKSSEANDTTSATVVLSGGRHGVPYLITNQVTTSGGLTLEKKIVVEIDDFHSVAE